jgi:esterase/lipase superfamily enzyme
MSGFVSRALSLSEQVISRIKSAPYAAPTLIRIRKDACSPSEPIGTKIPKDLAYFSIRVNELFLKEGRTFLDAYDPMLLVISEFLHGGERISVPFVVGAEMLQLPTEKVPSALRFNDILVAGPHPFRGGNVALSVILYKVQRDNYAKGVMKFVEGVSSAIGIPANIGLLTKVGNAFIDGLDTLLGMQGTVPIMGHRVEFDTATIAGFSSACFLLTSETRIDESLLRVTEGRLSVLSADGVQQDFRNADYVLYSILGNSRRGDESSLSFYPMRKQALNSVLSGEEGWRRAKATLLSMYQEMVSSDDLISAEADELFETYKAELLKAREKLQTTKALSTKVELLPADREKLNRATAILLDIPDPVSVSHTNKERGLVAPSTSDVKALQPVYYATNRKVTEGATLLASSFTAERSMQLQYGLTIVSVPKKHAIGNVERPSFNYFKWSYNKEVDTDHFRISSISRLSRDGFVDELRMNSESVLLFVHGYNVPFQDAVFKAAQIAYDANFSGSVLAFSWPSAGALYKYDYDRESAQFSGGDLLSVLRILTEEIDEKRIYVVAHSLGNQVLIDALQQAALSKVALKVSELVMAAPDVDKDVFLKKADEIGSVAKCITMYASSADKALLASDKKAWGARLGYIGSDGPSLAEGVETIDVTAVGDDMLGLHHSTFSGSRSVLDDLGRLIRSASPLSPIDRSPTLQFVPDKENVKYWLYPR